LRLKKIKPKLEKLAAYILFGGSVIYIFGQYGSLEFDMITPTQFIFRAGAALIVLGLVTWFINCHYVDGEWL
jgi:hypothetical protein